MTKTTYFKAQFRFESLVEISPACFDETKKKFVDYDLNIGWALRKVNSYCPYSETTSGNLKKDDHNYDRRMTKKCMGAISCLNSECAFFQKDVRPPTEPKKITVSKCIQCSRDMKWTKCDVVVEFYFSVKKLTCTMTHEVDDYEQDKEKETDNENEEEKEEKEIIGHKHGAYLAKHLTQAEKLKVDEMVNKESLYYSWCCNN
jgi:hypothetical protein